MSWLAIEGAGALVTGASRGIGEHIARELARRGARVALCARSTADLERVAAAIRDDGGHACAVPADLRELADPETGAQRARALVTAAERDVGPLAIVVNNAGAGAYAAVAELPLAVLREVFDLNVFAVHALTVAALPSLAARERGVVANVSSVLGRRAIPMSGGYCASKFAVEALSQSLRAELAGTGVRVVVVRPGRTYTSFQRAAASPTGWRPPAVRGMTAEAVARAAVAAIAAGRSSVDLTAAGRALIALERVSPALANRAMRKLARRLRDEPDPGSDPS